MRLDIKVATLFGISRERAKKMILNGQVTLNDVVEISPRFLVKDYDSINISSEVTACTDSAIIPNFDIKPEIIYEDEGILVINKQKGLMVHEGNSENYHTVVNALVAMYGEDFINIGSKFRPGIVHRLDKDTTGLMVIAKTQKTFDSLTKMIANREIKRQYLAVCNGIPERKAGTIKINIGTDPQNKTKKCAMQIGGREAITHYKVLDSHNGIALLECTLETGRTHQIRVHTAYIGHPIVGDQIYNKYIKSGINKEFNSQLLHAYRLELKNPTTGEHLKLTHCGAFGDILRDLHLSITG